MSAKKGGLGRGLDSLFSENSSESSSSVEVRLSEIEPNRNQPRKVFDEAALSELSESIKTHGLIQPLLVRPTRDGRYQIVAGERRWRASRMAGLSRVPVVIREMDDLKSAEIALIENLQREDLNAIEEAKGFKNLIDNFGMTQEEVAVSVGKSRPAVANALRLLGLTPEEMDLLSQSVITSGHARALLAKTDPEVRAMALKAAKNGASVREIERMSKVIKTEVPASAQSRAKNKLYEEVEIALTREVGRKIKVNGNGTSGTILIEFFNDDDLYEMAERIAGNSK
ncbi:MAG: ParB/RepB/Spo0J family partition protein [Oscillospiraceae bacterium]|nr:ParB/RepB/Spo0J family partition protein [Oscillospiraceae bacterium]